MNATQSNARFVVLAAVDHGPLDNEIVRAAANLARASSGAELHIVHVVEDLPPPVVMVPAPPGLGISKPEIVGAARERLDRLVAEARVSFSGRIVGHLAAGSAAKQILQAAIDLQADAVLVGTHGRKGIKRMLLGSVAEAVVRKASCPVVVVRSKDYHAFVPPEIEPACPSCVSVQSETGGERLYCDRHSERHARAHVHYPPEGPGAGSPRSRPRGGLS